ncbi:MAG: hypothetical protein AAFQ27_01415 [Pseudomonadota bacterium]
MTAKKPSDLPLVLMIVWYALLAAGAGILLLIGLAFGTEAYRNNPIPMKELVIIAGPLVFVIALLVGTILLWNSGKPKLAYGLCALSVVCLVAVPVFGGALGI